MSISASVESVFEHDLSLDIFSLFLFLSSQAFSSFFFLFFLTSPFRFIFWSLSFLTFFPCLSLGLRSSRSLSDLLTLDLLCEVCLVMRDCDDFRNLMSETGNHDFEPVEDVGLCLTAWMGLPWLFCCPLIWAEI